MKEAKTQSVFGTMRLAKKHLVFLLVLAILSASLLTACTFHEHVYGEWVRTKQPTCSEEGIQTRTCECGAEENSPVSKISHNYGNWEIIKNATCSSTGTKEHTCTVCGHCETSNIVKTEHTYGDWKITKDATCLELGEKERKCTACGKIDSLSISKTSHNWMDATCAQPKTCTICGKTEGGTLAHGSPTTDFYCSQCYEKVYASDYKYLAGSDFRSIRNDYSSAVASHATMILYRDSYSNMCVLIKVYYKIGSRSFSDLFLHNFTQNQRIADPETYYEYLKNRAYGPDKIKYMNILEGITEMQLHMLKNESTYTVDADYLNM